MPIYLSKGIGGGFRVGTRIGGGYGRKNDGCFLVTLVQGVLLLGIIGLFIAYWQIAIGIFVLWLIGTVWWGMAKETAKERAKLEAEVAKLGEKVQKHIDMVQNAKTLSARQNNCTKAIALLQEIKGLDPGGSVAQNTDSLLVTLSALEKTLPIGNVLERAERAEFKGQTKQALNAYLDAVFQCEKESVTDSDFRTADLRDGSTDEQVSLEYLKNKARSLGWEDPSVGQLSSAPAMPAAAPEPEIECPNCNHSSPFSAFRADQNGKGTCPQCGIHVEFE